MKLEKREDKIEGKKVKEKSLNPVKKDGSQYIFLQSKQEARLDRKGKRQSKARER